MLARWVVIEDRVPGSVPAATRRSSLCRRRLMDWLPDGRRSLGAGGGEVLTWPLPAARSHAMRPVRPGATRSATCWRCHALGWSQSLSQRPGPCQNSSGSSATSLPDRSRSAAHGSMRWKVGSPPSANCRIIATLRSTRPTIASRIAVRLPAYPYASRSRWNRRRRPAASPNPACPAISAVSSGTQVNAENASCFLPGSPAAGLGTGLVADLRAVAAGAGTRLYERRHLVRDLRVGLLG